jgi:amino acid permease
MSDSSRSGVRLLDGPETGGEQGLARGVPDALPPGHTKVGFFGTVVTLVNVLVGAGILGVPSTFNSTGIVPSILIMTLIVAISHFATVLTLALQKATAADGMDEVAGKIIGPKGMAALSSMILVFNVSAMLAYLIIGIDLVISFFSFGGIDLSGRWPRAGVVLVYGLCCPIALSVPRSLKILSYVSGLTCVCILTYVVVMVVQLAMRRGEVVEHPVIATMNLDVFGSIGIYALAFALPVCICPVIVDSDRNIKVLNAASAASLATSLILTIIPSICGYLLYGEECKGNIINNFPDNDWVILALRIVFLVVVSFSYPATHPPVACSWASVLFHVNQAMDLFGWKRVAVLVISNAIPLAIAVFLPDVKPALEIGGSIGGCLGNFVIPGWMWVKHSVDPIRHWKNVLAIAMVVFGIVAAGLSGYYAVRDAIEAFRK